MERVVLTTGGTGGHIFPALAVAEELLARHPGIGLLFVGSEYGPEAELCARAGVPFAGLPVRGFWGRGLKAPWAAACMLRAVWRTVFLLRRAAPQAVMGFGGYAAFAAVLAARCLGIPAAVHEQNARAGVSNAILGRLTGNILCSLPETQGFGGRPVVLTGNPVRRCVLEAGHTGSRGGGKRLLIMGGSQGAKAVNSYVARSLPRFREAGIAIWHQSGGADYERMLAAYKDAGMEGARVEPFIHDMGRAYAWADLAMCRSGATTVAELAACGLPAACIPFPHATHDHQTANARLLERQGAALVVAESELEQRDCAGLVTALLGSPEKLAAMSEAARKLARPRAAAAVADFLEELAGQGERRNHLLRDTKHEHAA
ncbi:MAG: undecaprenyldiphospho-muramoylpentapeptide beta-N-acetylglucosaminyltransferase [Deltaproteobacteria bacterium]|nr:undecaprenyldiphospho-muramoylpentapeptide beta-N-acetylglucosaminyltransferase [Deltaproteobacteria bacterium]